MQYYFPSFVILSPNNITMEQPPVNHLFYHCNSVEQFHTRGTRVSVLNHMPVKLWVHAAIFSRACNAIFVFLLPARGKIAVCIMPATLTATMSGNAKNCCRKSKSFNFSLQHFQDCTSKISENWKLQRLSLMFTRNAIILFKLTIKTSQNRDPRNLIN